MPAHYSHWLQPLDRTVFGPLKTYYNQICHELINGYPGVTVDKPNFCGLSKNNIISGFRSCGIYPYNPSAVPSIACLPNSVYSIQQLLDENDLLESSLQPMKTNTRITISENSNEEEVDFEIESTTNIPKNMSEHEIGYNTDLVKLDNNTASLVWDTYLTHEQLTIFNCCIQNSYDIPDPLYKVYKEFKLKKSSRTKDISEVDVPMSNGNTDLPIPILNETIVQSNPTPNEITGQSSYLTNETPSHYN